MSSKNRKKKSRTDDAYSTPAWCIERFAEVGVPELRQAKTILEPCMGDGVVTGCWPDKQWAAVELRDVYFVPPHVDAWFPCTDFLKWAPQQPTNVFDAVVTNPPYTHALEFLQASLRLAPHVFFFLRVGFLESETRAEWIQNHQPDLYMLPNRPSFDGEGTDSCTYAWMHFMRGERKQGVHQMLNLTPLSVRSEAKRMARMAA